MPLLETTKETAIDVIKDLLHQYSYAKIYLSFGSKYNEQQVIYNSPVIPNRNTNARFQMLPAFLHDYPESDRILSICIDDFSNIDNKNINKRIIGSVIKGSIDFVFVHWKLEVNDLHAFLCPFLQTLKDQDVHPDQLYCILYCKFMHPNMIEQTFSTKIRELAVSIFKDSLYRNSLFIWFGYQPNMYNCVYPAYYSCIHYSYSICMIQNNFDSDAIRSYEIEEWVSQLDPYFQRQIIPFLKNCFDITQYSNDGNLWPIYQTIT